ncbi:hypothetical protein F652_1753 [Enterobacteriaceae bacterium bta3-1]|nr:hypothetical protein F652_1753 [Enterobacteriaceae bacterium bta3-1]
MSVICHKYQVKKVSAILMTGEIMCELFSGSLGGKVIWYPNQI